MMVLRVAHNTYIRAVEVLGFELIFCATGVGLFELRMLGAYALICAKFKGWSMSTILMQYYIGDCDYCFLSLK